MEGILDLRDRSNGLLNDILIGLLPNPKDQKLNDLYICNLINQFQLDPVLLDFKLNEILKILQNLYWGQNFNSFIYNVFYTLCKVRGERYISKYLNFNSEILIKLINIQMPNWKGKYFQMIWLSKLVLIPFPLESIEFGLSKKIFNFASIGLKSNGKDNESASLLMSAFILRNDQINFLNFYIENLELNLPNLMTLNKILKSQKIIKIDKDKLIRFNPMTLLESKYWIKCLSKLAWNNDSPILLTKILKLLIDKFDSREPDLRLTIAKQVSKLILILNKESQIKIIDIMLDNLMNLPWTIIHSTLLTIGFIGLQHQNKHNNNKIPEFLINKLIKILPNTLFMSKKSMNRTFGVDIRDSSCFVIWSICKNGGLKYKQWDKIGLYLQLVCKLDNDSNVKRAANASLQEFIGRNPNWTSEFKMKMLNCKNIEDVINLNLEMIDILEWWCWLNISNGNENVWDQIKLLMKFKPLGILNKIKLMDKCDFKRVYLIGHLYEFEKIRELQVDYLNWNDFNYAKAIFHFLNGKIANGFEIDLELVFKIQDEYDIKDEFFQFMKHIPVNEQLINLCGNRLNNLTICEGIGFNKCGLKLKDDIVEIMKISKGTLGCQIKTLLVSSCPSFDVISIALDDYNKSEQGDVGSWVRFKAVEVLMNIKEGIPLELQYKLIRLACEPNVKIHTLAFTLLRYVFSFEKQFELVEEVNQLVKIGDEARGEVTIGVSTTCWVRNMTSCHYLELVWLYLDQLKKDEKMSGEFWRGILTSFNTKATRSFTINGLIEGLKDSEDIGMFISLEMKNKLRLMGMQFGS